MGYVTPKWDMRFLQLAAHVATWSKDPSTKVGAVIANDKFLVSVGYNGFPSLVYDTEKRLEHRETKYKMIVHAESNAIISAKRDLFGYTMYCSLFPCTTCAGLIIQSGIHKVVAPQLTDPALKERWQDSMDTGMAMFIEAGIACETYNMDDYKNA